MSGIYLWFAYSEVGHSPTDGSRTLCTLLATLYGWARNSAQRACIGHPQERPATTTNRDSRSRVGVATGARFARDGVTGSAQTVFTTSRLALGLDSTEDGYQMEKVIPYHPAVAMGA